MTFAQLLYLYMIFSSTNMICDLFVVETRSFLLTGIDISSLSSVAANILPSTCKRMLNYKKTVSVNVMMFLIITF